MQIVKLAILLALRKIELAPALPLPLAFGTIPATNPPVGISACRRD